MNQERQPPPSNPRQLGLLIAAVLGVVAVAVVMAQGYALLSRQRQAAADEVAQLEASQAAQPFLTYGVLYEQETKPAEYLVEYLFDAPAGVLPPREQLVALSEQVAASNPGFERYHVAYFLPEMESGGEPFATAHHNPELDLSINLLASPEYRHQEIYEYYELEKVR